MNAKRKQSGFSLIELLVAMALFLTAMLIATDIFVSVSGRQQKTLARQRAINELRYDMYFLTQQIKANRIDYDMFVEPLKVVEQQLFLKDKNEKAIIFKVDGTNCPAGTAKCLSYFKENVGWKVLSSSAVDFDFVKFYIKPDRNPLDLDKATGEYASNDQSVVTIVLQAFAPSDPEKKINLQTTVSSRVYGR
jgi:prepilin-type N-terminal cleavage/methylation domain-containing protein